MAIVARGLGLPDDGALVAGGLGTSDVDANAMAALLSGSSSLAATLSVADVAVASVDLGGRSRRRQRTVVYVDAAASLDVAVRSSTVGDVVHTVAAPDVVERPSWSLLPALPVDIVATAAARLGVAALSSATSVRAVSSSATSLTHVGVVAAAVGETTWSVLDDEDELFLLLAS